MAPTLDQFAKACGATVPVAQLYFDHAVAAMDRFNITSREAVAALCATVSVETARLTAMEESLYYRDAARIADLYKRIFDTNKDRKITPDEIERAKPYVRNSAKVSELLYKGYHGRGGAMLTWVENYRIHGKKLGYDYEGNPALVKEPFHAMLTACSFFDSAKCNECADDMSEVTLRWNGPRRLHLAERIQQYGIALSVL